MAVNFQVLETYHAVEGVRLGVTQAHVRCKARDDMVLIELAEGAEVVRVFTLNAFCAAPVQICKQHLQKATPRYLLINTGNANAGTGKKVIANAIRRSELEAQATDCQH